MPKVSVVIASKVGAPFIDQCLGSIAPEVSRLGAEAIVVIADGATYASRIATQFPWTRVISEPGLRRIPELRRRGVEAATGEFVAIIEEHCSAATDWLHAALAAHSSGEYGAVGGAISDYDYDRLRDWVVYFCEYNGAFPPAPEGETAHLNDANIVYRRSILVDNLALLDDGYWPMTLHPTLRAKGVKMRSVPGMVVYHRGPFDFAYYLHQRFLFSKAFAGVRAQTQPLIWRLAYIVGAPLMPLMLLTRMAKEVVAKRRRIRQFVLTLPLTVPALVVFVAGEWVGCVFGPGDALAKVE